MPDSPSKLRIKHQNVRKRGARGRSYGYHMWEGVELEGVVMGTICGSGWS